MKQLTSISELLDLFHPAVHAQINRLLERPNATLVVYQNQDLCSSHLGERTVLLVAPGCTYASLNEAPPYLGDLPSQRQYPMACFAQF